LVESAAPVVASKPFKAVTANIDYPAILDSLENEMVNLVTETLWQMESIRGLQRKIQVITEQMDQGLSAMTFPPANAPAHLN
jgi:hypothetical protein